MTKCPLKKYTPSEILNDEPTIGAFDGIVVAKPSPAEIKVDAYVILLLVNKISPLKKVLTSSSEVAEFS